MAKKTFPGDLNSFHNSIPSVRDSGGEQGFAYSEHFKWQEDPLGTYGANFINRDYSDNSLINKYPHAELSRMAKGTGPTTDPSWLLQTNQVLGEHEFWYDSRNPNKSSAILAAIRSTYLGDGMTISGIIPVLTGDKIWISGKNSTDTSDYTVRNFNLNLVKI